MARAVVPLSSLASIVLAFAAQAQLSAEPAKGSPADSHEAGSQQADAAGEASAPHALHPPFGIAAGHTLRSGGIAFGYAYQRESYQGLREGESRRDPTDVRNRFGFARTPERLDVERHEFALMYAPTDRITVMANLPLVKKEMVELTNTGSFRVRSQGIGDLSFTAIARFMEKGDELLYVSAEVGAPTGSIRAGDTTPLGFERLPYPMQLGAGSWHIETGLTYQGHSWDYTWGGRITTLFRLRDNDLGYQLGNRYSVSGWLSRRWLDWLSTSIRLEWRKWGNVQGPGDFGLDPRSSPSADPKRQGGEHVDIGGGIDIAVPFLAHQSLALEAVWPVLQSLDGPQIEQDWQVRAGWRWSY